LLVPGYLPRFGGMKAIAGKCLVLRNPFVITDGSTTVGNVLHFLRSKIESLREELRSVRESEDIQEILDEEA
jgi:hypothetical protein